MSLHLHPARDDEVGRIWPMAKRARLFGSLAEFEAFRTEAPWRLQVSSSGECAVLDRWREHLAIVAMRGAWCAADRIPALVDRLMHVVRDQQMTSLLSPLVAEEVAPAYRAAGMHPLEDIVVLRRVSRQTPVAPAALPPGVRIRPPLPADLAALLEVDAACFNDFWRYDIDKLARHFVEDRLMVAEEDGAAIGYTLATVIGDSATLGRLAVAPGARGRGVGAALLAEALGYLERTGAATVSLCTQRENVVSRALYARAGLRELPGKLQFLIRDVSGE